MRIRHFVDPGLGNSAYLLISETERAAALIDPLRDVDQYVDIAHQDGARITHVLETHLHNDFLSGSREVASLTGAGIVASADAGLEFDHQPVQDGDVITLGDIRISVLATPGHTPEHVSYLAHDTSQPADPPVLFSGGSLLVGAVSRTDLLGHEHATGLAHQLYRSLHERILPLGDDVMVYPTHGAGSFCAAAASAESTTTIGRERRTNLLLAERGPEAFAERLQASLPSYPTYFDRMRALNKRGPRVLGSIPRLARLGTALVYPTLLAAVSDVAHPDWRASAVGVYRLWRDSGYAAGAILAGVLADLLGVPFAIAAIAALTFASGVVVLARMYETLPAKRTTTFEPALSNARSAQART
jgi:hydroxyacylglutathione hydrolase